MHKQAVSNWECKAHYLDLKAPKDPSKRVVGCEEVEAGVTFLADGMFNKFSNTPSSFGNSEFPKSSVTKILVATNYNNKKKLQKTNKIFEGRGWLRELLLSSFFSKIYTKVIDFRPKNCFLAVFLVA